MHTADAMLEERSYMRQSRAGVLEAAQTPQHSHCHAVMPLPVAFFVNAESAASSMKGSRREGRGNSGFRETTSQLYGETDFCHPGSGLPHFAVLS